MPTSLISTDALLTQALAGDAECVGPLLERYTGYLNVLTQAQLNPRIRNRVGVSDIVQETLLEAHRDLRQFHGRSSGEFLAWLRKVLLHNVARACDRHLGAEKRDVRREMSFDHLGGSVEGSAERLQQMLVDGGPTPSGVFGRQEELLALADALATLPDDYRDVMVFRHLEGLTFREVGQRMERSEGAVRMLWMRAVDRLRMLLREKGVL